ncbi:serine carboxypeptidase S28 family protein [Striga asiatica]|uniref:Serine carboxypeptidase S28 family protein n=1 Tax=Striga asiatica TaxID=4170 RepID=A0A5A7Q8W2_STRAF|nr:serine carboxypeptidase S28 family protein [Striga asiatica]
MAIWLMLVLMLSSSFHPKSFSTHAINTKKTKPIGFPFSFIQPEQAQASLDAKAVVRLYKEKFYTQTLDHFNFNLNSYQIFQQRYLINDTFWGGPKGNFPIFVYTGNEGGIEWFAQNTGFMFEIAPVFKAMLVFIEHRFYGKSMPFGGSQSTAYSNSTTLGYLSSTQALADYATLILDLKKNLTAEKCPVVVFGGSYGGMLAAWFRLKYPHVAIGALSSSAPILNFDNITSPYSFNDVITKDFRSESENCYQVIKRSWQEIEETAAKPEGLEILRKSFKICKNYITANSLEGWLSTAYTYTAMTDYPTSSNFLNPMPAYPVKQMCKAIDDAKTGINTFEKLYRAASVYYNYTGQAQCFDLNDNSDQLGVDGWSWQACTEMSLLTGGSSKDSIFSAYNYTYNDRLKYCKYYFNIVPRPSWIPTEFGAHNIYRVLKRFGSNIIFFNGLRDPWSPGGVLKNISKSIVAIVAKEGAHHVDLRFSTSEDPKWLRDVRQKEVQIISKWLTQYHNDLINYPSS